MNLAMFVPETLIACVSVALLFLMLGKEEPSPAFLRTLTAAGGVAAAVAAYSSTGFMGSLFASTYRIDAFSQGFKAVLGASFAATAFLSGRVPEIPSRRRTEFYFFLSTALLGMMLLTSAVDLLTLYVSLELSSYSLYLLAAMGTGPRNSEAGVKYLVFGAASSGFFLWGASLLAGLAGTTSIAALGQNAQGFISTPAFFVGALFLLFSFLFKLSAFPFHFWAPDVYESAATPVTAYVATVSKAVAVAVFIRLLLLIPAPVGLVPVLSLLAFVSMTVGNAAALVQRDVKRLLAYSSVAQAGYLLVGLLSLSFEGYSSCFFYAVIYLLTQSAAFLVVLCVARASGQDNPQMSDFNGLAEKSPFLALMLLLSLLSLAGIPPLAGFTGKWILFTAAMEKGHWFLVLWAVLNSVVSLFYYLTLVKHAYLEKPPSASPLPVPLSFKILGLAMAVGIVALGVFPNGLITVSQQAIADALIHY